MTIKELMAQVDVNRVTDAFLLLDYHFSEENFENSFIEKYEVVPKYRKIIEENIRLFAECTTNDDTVSHTIFIMYNQDGEDYEEQWKKSFSCFAICDEEVLPLIDKDFHVFDNEGEALVSHYGIDNAPMQDMANYVIAKSSIKELAGPIDEKELIDSKTFWKKMKPYEDELLSKMSDDEKAYCMAKEKFEEETEEIRNRYWYRVKDEIHKQYIDAIKAEYRGR